LNEPRLFAASYNLGVSFVYILRCGDGSLYTGIAKDLAARLRQHQAGRASRYTRARLPVTLVWWRELTTWSDALREEQRIKRLRRREKEMLLAPSPGDLQHAVLVEAQDAGVVQLDPVEKKPFFQLVTQGLLGPSRSAVSEQAEQGFQGRNHLSFYGHVLGG
jgi:putative endonuclease